MMKVCIKCKKEFNSIDWKCPFCGALPNLSNSYISFNPNLDAARESYNPEFFDKLAKIEANHFWFEYRNKLILWIIQQYSPLAKNFLEIGCGTGFVISYIQRMMPRLVISGSEIYSEGLKFVSVRLKDVTLYQMDARQIPFNNEFDLIGVFDVIEHIEDDSNVLQQINKALKPGGKVVITVPQHKFLWTKIDELSYHKRRYTKQELEQKITTAGFTILKIVPFMSLLMPFQVISRLFNKNSDLTEENVVETVKMNRFINAVFKFITTIEYLFIQSGLGFNFGGSLILIACKTK
jgi:SAM-dependent methyltransferase